MKSIVRILSILVVMPFAVQAAENSSMLGIAEYIPGEKVLELVSKPQRGIQVVKQLEQWHRDNDLNAQEKAAEMEKCTDLEAGKADNIESAVDAGVHE